MAVAIRSHGTLSEQLRDTEDRLSFQLPERYRRWLATTNGGEPELALTLPTATSCGRTARTGCVRSRPLKISLTRTATFRIASPPTTLPVASVSGGMLALKVKGERHGSVWLWSDDDPRASDEDTPEDTERLLFLCAGSWKEFLDRLQVPEPISDEKLDELIRRHDVRLETGPGGEGDPGTGQGPHADGGSESPR